MVRVKVVFDSIVFLSSDKIYDFIVYSNGLTTWCMFNSTDVTGGWRQRFFTRQTSHTNDFVNAKNHTREKPLFAG